MKYPFIKILFVLTTILLLSCQHQMSKEEKEALEAHRLDSIMKEKKELAQDSISKLGNSIFSSFYFGMSRKEYEKARSDFQEETNGQIKLESLIFKLYNPEFDGGKLSCLALGASNILNEFQGLYVGTDYSTILKERYIHKLGKPDLFLNEEYKECDSASNNLKHIVWLFNKRAIHISFSDHFMSDGRLEKYYWIYYNTIENWTKTKKTFDSIYDQRQKERESYEKKTRRYSDVI